MKSVIEQLYSGEIYPAEQIRPTDNEYKGLYGEIDTEVTYLKQKLSQEDGDRFEKMEDLFLSVNNFEVTAGFSYGFKLGALLMLEILTKDEISPNI